MRLSRLDPQLEALRAASVLDAIDVHFAASLGALVQAQSTEVLLAAALVSHATREGHVCVALPKLAGRAIGSSVELGSWPDLKGWRRELEQSPLVSAEAEHGGAELERRPLVLDRAGRLYLHRYYEHEQELAAELRGRAGTRASAHDPLIVRELLARLFDTPPDAPLDDQQVAVLLALVQRFVIISGGPGTGKTSTVTRLLALLVELALGEGVPPPRILLLAPTGKAAGRLVESMQLVKGRLAAPASVLALLPEQARTIHRALGVRKGGGYWRSRARPLVADVVLVDEASMVDLALMRHLVDAVPEGARLILLGDRHQLASVEAGSVLSEICAAARPAQDRGFSAELCQVVEGLVGKTLPSAAGAAPPLRDHVVELTKSYRFDAASAIGRLALAVRSGDEEAAFQVLARGEGVVWVEQAPSYELSPALCRHAVEGFRPALQANGAAEAQAALGDFRVLCAHRRGFAGVEHLNQRIGAALARAGFIDGRAEFFPGRPVLVTRNDAAVELFNGDVGVAWGGAGSLKVHFGSRAISPARLPGHETAFAMSIHKSQGSEHAEVVIVLPDADSPLLCRELLYTAVTRAKERVCIYATRETLQRSLRQSVARASGLADALS